MPKYFLDTSALAKIYRKEAGSDVVDRIFSETESRHVISLLTLVEMESVFALKARTGQIDQPALQIARRRLQADLERGRLLLAVFHDEHFQHARRLILRHGFNAALRTLDSLQLSVALDLKRAGFVTVFVAADQKLCNVASLEGFTVIDPEQPTPIGG